MLGRFIFGCLAAGLLLATALSAAAAPAADPAEGVVWDLGRLYPDDSAWDKERTAVEAALPGLGALKGRLGASPETLRDGLDRISELRRRVERLHA
jgi:hypothetical protein